MAKLKVVSRDAYIARVRELVKLPGHIEHPIDGFYVCAMQHVVNDAVRAQAFYRRGVSAIYYIEDRSNG